MMTVSNTRIEQSIIELLGRRAAAASICPSDVARALDRDEDGWRALMPRVRRVAARLARDQVVVITQGARTLAADQVDQGAIRLRRGPAFDADR
jgi:hypothetical protein